ncbi:Golgi reassembly stacking protein GRASP65, contains PDZ domain [Phaffia rhodozyma]|uniref:Golgi reassembly stacking protein GRASP65, contains PDZ domain n=1 Tax=Phaffia rhodozyma TaxID=264483 RepID=A0A0F7SIX3_PHARH|nr:Golgi reassembly stacking protein GRASP65, contains PDZ domain [Phaffia rhodozyma]
MGNAPSSASGSFSENTKALHVLRVAEQSPAAEAGIQPFFDFIVGIDGVETDLSPESLSSTVDSFESRPLTLLVYSSKRQETRRVTLIPSRAWASEGSEAGSPYNRSSRPLPPSNPSASSALPPTEGSAHSHDDHSPLANSHSHDDHSSNRPHHSHNHSQASVMSQSQSQPSLLGLSLRFCTPQSALENVWHILEILEGSPAESAGLVPYGDWIIGWAGGVLQDENDFYDVVEGHVDMPLRLFVYSADFDTLREVVLVPNRQWGGEGLLGCGVGYGLLHRIPKPQDSGRPRELDEPSGRRTSEVFDLSSDRG